MAEFWFLFICNMFIPVTMLVLGYLFKEIHFPKDVNALCGYRTSMSMKNEKTQIRQCLLGKNLLADWLGCDSGHSLCDYTLLSRRRRDI